nr:hypothetical protein [uncultured bacterium]
MVKFIQTYTIIVLSSHAKQIIANYSFRTSSWSFLARKWFRTFTFCWIYSNAMVNK